MELAFGKFKGLSVDDPEVKTKYLEWLYGEMITTSEAIQAELARREQIEAGDLSMAERIVFSGTRQLAKEYKDKPEMLRQLAGAEAALSAVLAKYFGDQAEDEEVDPDVLFAIEREACAQIVENSPHGSDITATAQKIRARGNH